MQQKSSGYCFALKVQKISGFCGSSGKNTKVRQVTVFTGFPQIISLVHKLFIHCTALFYKKDSIWLKGYCLICCEDTEKKNHIPGILISFIFFRLFNMITFIHFNSQNLSTIFHGVFARFQHKNIIPGKINFSSDEKYY